MQTAWHMMSGMMLNSFQYDLLAEPWRSRPSSTATCVSISKDSASSVQVDVVTSPVVDLVTNRIVSWCVATCQV
eukprot:666130-Amphidinium_carterae.1